MADISAKQLGLRKSDLPHSIIEVISTLNKAGFEAYIVGGGVRDNLLGLDPKDFDAVTNAKPTEIKDVFGKRCRIIGRRFQLAHVYSGKEMIEVATFRAPPSNDNAQKTEEGMLTRDNVWGNIQQDAKRRDFSINAMYYQPLQGVVKDFCEAHQDISTQTLRLLGNAKTRIEEDPVRLLRALRFKAKLGFEFDDDLAEQFNASNWSLLEQVSPHRLYDESQKMFTGGYIVPLLPLLYQYGAIKHLFLYPDSEPSQLVNHIAYNTDKRIRSGKSINPAFFYAGLLWKNYLHQLDKNKKRNMPFDEAQKKACSKVIERQRKYTAIPRFHEQFIKDIWLLQPRLANPRTKTMMQLAEHPKFRAGFDFLLLREQCGEQDTPLAESTNGMGEWWQDFQTLSEKEQLRAVKKFSSNARNEGRRKKRKDNKSDQQTTETVSATQQKESYAKQPPKSSKELSKRRRQDSEEKAQLQMLSLAMQEVVTHKKTNRPSPLFIIDSQRNTNASTDKVSDTTKSGTHKKVKTANKNSHKPKTTKNVIKLPTTEATQLQRVLLASAHTPKQRARKTS